MNYDGGASAIGTEMYSQLFINRANIVSFLFPRITYIV